MDSDPLTNAKNFWYVPKENIENIKAQVLESFFQGQHLNTPEIKEVLNVDPTISEQYEFGKIPQDIQRCSAIQLIDKLADEDISDIQHRYIAKQLVAITLVIGKHPELLPNNIKKNLLDLLPTTTCLKTKEYIAIALAFLQVEIEHFQFIFENQGLSSIILLTLRT